MPAPAKELHINQASKGHPSRIRIPDPHHVFELAAGEELHAAQES
jgi:hypothetical protein